MPFWFVEKLRGFVSFKPQFQLVDGHMSFFDFFDVSLKQIQTKPNQIPLFFGYCVCIRLFSLPPRFPLKGTFGWNNKFLIRLKLGCFPHLNFLLGNTMSYCKKNNRFTTGSVCSFYRASFCWVNGFIHILFFYDKKGYRQILITVG